MSVVTQVEVKDQEAILKQEFNEIFCNFNLKERTFFNQKELDFFEKITKINLQKAQRDLALITDHSSNNENGTDDTAPNFKAFEEGSQVMSKEQNADIVVRQVKYIRDLKNTLIRIKNHSYGICRLTKKLINPNRLRLVPHATLSIEGKNKLNEN